jgi:predicted ATPase
MAHGSDGQPPLIGRLTIRNYKSIAACVVDLAPLVFLVGPNGSGKSNVLDAIRFVADSLRTSLDHALRDRGTIRDVRRRSGGHPNHFSIRLDFHLPNDSAGHYSFRIGARPNGGYEVQDEECVVRGTGVGGGEHSYRVRSGQVIAASFSAGPISLPDRLFLVAVAGQPAFRPVYDALSNIEMYSLDPRAIGSMQRPDIGDLLSRDGSNAASVLQRLPAARRDIVNGYLARIVTGVAGVEPKTLGSQETVEFRQIVRGQPHPWRFLASSMSDGTLRALGVLVAVFQAAEGDASTPWLIGLEEPEIALHPAAAGVLLAALREGARHRQILVTSHSPDLLDNPDIPVSSLLAVENVDGLTRIGPVDTAGRSVMRERLFTAGELLRQNQLSPDTSSVFDTRHEHQLDLFELAEARR